MAENNISFEMKLKRLEEIVRALEASEVELDKSLALFEEGTVLVRECTEELDKAQEKITVITKEQNNE